MTSFNDLSLSPLLLKAIEELVYKHPTPVQQQVIPEVLRRNDLLVSAQTGTGKTAAFALPLLQLLLARKKQSVPGKIIEVLVLSPTRELAVQIEENIRACSKYTNIVSGVAYGGAAMQPQIEMLKAGVDILVATPGRLLDLRKQGFVNLEEVQVLVLDEADLMLDMGFIDEVQKIIRLSSNLVQRLMFSATIPAKVAYLAKSYLKEPVKIEIDQPSSAAVGITQRLYMVPKPQKIELLLHVMRKVVGEGSVLIFRRTKFGVEKAVESLQKNGFLAETLHGNMSQSERNRVYAAFKNSEVPVLVATDVAARGLDVENLDWVINFDIPNVPEVYVHRIGRTGRAGNTGASISFASADERENLKKIEKVLGKKLEIEENNPFPVDRDASPEVHKKKGSKHRKGRKGSGSKNKKNRWY